jgi:serine/threonine protein kinase
VYKGRLFGTDVAVKILEKKKKKSAESKPKADSMNGAIEPNAAIPANGGGGLEATGQDVVENAINAAEEAKCVVQSEVEGERGPKESSHSHSHSTQSQRGSEKESSCGSQNEVIRYEIGMMSEINHPNILKFLGTCQSRELGQCIIVEYIDGGTLLLFFFIGCFVFALIR